jgi:hypothetical protein
MSDKENADILRLLARQQMVKGTSEMTFSSIAARLNSGDGSSLLKNSLDSLRRRGYVLLNLKRNSQTQGAPSSFLYSLNSPVLLQKAAELKGYTTFPPTRDNDESSGAQGKSGPLSLSAVEQLFSIPVATQIFQLYDMDQRDWLRLASVSSEWHDLCRKGDHLEVVHFKPRGKCNENGKLAQLVKSLPGLRHLTLTKCPKITDEDLKELRPLPNLKSLDLSGCSDVTDKGLQELSSITSLQSLNLTDLLYITTQGLKALFPLRESLQSLNLTGCHYLDDGDNLTAICRFKKLRSLTLSTADIFDEDLQRLSSSLPELRSLTLSKCD